MENYGMGKLGWGLALLLAAGVGGWFLANYLVRLLLGVYGMPLSGTRQAYRSAFTVRVSWPCPRSST
ncbi:MAG: hypothetical protein ABI128_08510 [Rhodanobacter sp.]